MNKFLFAHASASNTFSIRTTDYEEGIDALRKLATNYALTGLGPDVGMRVSKLMGALPHESEFELQLELNTFTCQRILT